MPTRAAACDPWGLRCSGGATTTTWSTVRSPSSSPAMRRANVVLPAPGVATARKSLGLAVRYFTNARRCQPRKAWVLGPSAAPEFGTELGRTRDSYLVEGQSRARGYGIAHPRHVS